MKFDYQDFQKRLSEVGNSTEELLRLNTELMLNVAQKIAGVEDPRKSEKGSRGTSDSFEGRSYLQFRMDFCSSYLCRRPRGDVQRG